MAEIARVSVIDAFEIKTKTPGSRHKPGLVIVFDGRQCSFRLPPVGSVVELLRLDGSRKNATIAESKQHGDGRSFFFAAAKRADAPIGTIVSWRISLAQGQRKRASEAAA
jgi:hypothetical protein